MNRKVFIKQFNPLFSAYLHEQVAECKELLGNDGLQQIIEQVDVIFGGDGKRIRPYMLYLMHRSVGGRDENTAFRVGIASELLHAFALIHDDVCDRGKLRHGQMTIQELVKQQHEEAGITFDSEHQANSQAMLAGDIVLAWGFAALNELNSNYKEIIQSQYQTMLIRTIAGEMLDVSLPARMDVTDDELQQRDRLKTATDTFVYPLLMGATLAGKHDKYADFSHSFGNLMGEVFQIQDDILDIVGEAGTSNHSDIDEHQHTFLTQYVIENGSTEDKAIMREFYSGQAPSKVNEEKVLKLVSQEEVIKAAIEASNVLTADARKLLDAVSIDESYKRYWREVLHFFESRFTS